MLWITGHREALAAGQEQFPKSAEAAAGRTIQDFGADRWWAWRKRAFARLRAATPELTHDLRTASPRSQPKS